MRIVAIASFFLVAGSALAQTDRGTITGTITDPAGAVVANANIEAKNTETGAIYPAVSTATGNYTIAQVPVGSYELQVTVTGFKKYVRQNIRIQAAQTVGLDATLEVGSATESVTVSAEVSLLKTESSDVATNVDSAKLISLPILPIGNGYSSSHGVRNPMAVTNLAPGTYFDPNLNLKVNGAPSNTEAVHVDGQDATNGVVTFSQAQTQPSVDALQELSIQSSNFAAEYGQAGAGLFNYTTKSGTNQYHGLLYDNLANEAFNAAQAYTRVRPQIRRNNFGGNLGGTISIPKIYNGHDRTFFFFNYEAFKEKGIITNQTPTVPTDAYRAGNFATARRVNIAGNPADSTGRVAVDGEIFDPLTETRDALGRRIRQPFTGNVIPLTRFDPSALKLLGLIPTANFGGPTKLVQNYNSPYPTDRYTSIPGLKIDHTLNSKMKLAGYWSRTATAVQFCTPLCGSDGLPAPITATRGTFIESQTERIQFDYTVAPTMLFHLAGGFLRNDFKDRAPTTDFDLQGTLGIKGATLGPNDGGRFPIFTGGPGTTGMFGLNSQGGINNMGPAAGQVRAVEDKPTFNTSLTWVKDNHTFKFGGEFRLDAFYDYTYTSTTGNFTIDATQTSNPYFTDASVTLGGGTTGFPLASLMLGRVTQAQIAPFSAFRGGRHYLALFAQDTWKISRRLTVDYGLRYDYSTYSKEQYGRVPGFSPTVINAAAGGHPGGAYFEGEGPGHCNCTFGKNYPLAFGPRVGAAYQINDKTVLRAGFGISYSAYTGGRYAGAPGALQTISTPSTATPAMILSGGITNQGVLVTPVFPDIRPNIFPLPGSTATPAGFLVYDNNNGRPARQTQWSIGLQREIFRDLVVEAAYVGNRGAWWRSSALNDYNGLTLDILKQNGLDITNTADRTILGARLDSASAGRFQGKIPYTGFPTSASVAQSLRPFPQFGALTGAGPLGSTWYDSLQAKVTKRLSHGLDVSYAFTYSKELQLGADTDGGAVVGQINDVFNRNTNKQLSSFSRPFVNVLAVSYTTPKVGPNAIVRYVTADWSFGTVLQYASGLPIPSPGTAASNLATTLLRGTHAERVPGVSPFLQDLDCHCFDPAQTPVLNPAAWRDPSGGTFAQSAYYFNDYRYQRRPRETMSVGRAFKIKERISLQIRAEFQNIFNRTQTPNPVATGAFNAAITRTANVNNAGFGAISTLPANAVIGERSGLLVARLSF